MFGLDGIKTGVVIILIGSPRNGDTHSFKKLTLTNWRIINMKLTNDTMYMMADILSKPEFSNCNDDTLNYAIYRNIRILRNGIQDYLKTLRNGVIKYGKEEQDGYVLTKSDTEAYNAFIEEMKPFSQIETDVELYQIEPGFILPECSGITPAQYLLIEEVLTKKDEIRPLGLK